jgi:endonuclease YncB( thermonuclease family)
MKRWIWVIIGIGLGVAILAQMFLVGLKYEKLDFLRVVDGDTFWVKNLRDDSEWKVRLWAVNAPDTKECYFDESTKILEKELVGKKLIFERHGYDGFGRILAKVSVDGRNLEEILVATGAAEVYDAAGVHDELKPSVEYVQSLKKIEEKAKNENLGMWSETCVRM